MSPTDIDREFKETVVDGFEKIEAKQQSIYEQQTKLLDDVSRLDKDTKSALEELTRLKSHANDVETVIRKLERATLALERERKASFGSPIDRALSNEEFRLFLNALFRRLAAPTMRLPDHLERALTGADSSMGQATVPTEHLGELYSLLDQYGAYSTLRVIQVGARTTVLPIQTARPSFYWIGGSTGGTSEGSAINEGTFTGASVNLAIQTVGTLIHVSRELIQDAAVDISAQVLQDLASGVANGIDHIAFAAGGASNQTDAGYTGIFNSGSVNSNCTVTATTGRTTVQATKVDDWEKCLAGVTTSVLRRNARWWMHPKILSKAMLVKDANDRPIFQTALETPEPRAIVSILGYPVITTPVAPSANAANAKVAVFGDPDGYVVGIRQDMEVASTDALKFAENMISFRCVARAGGKHRIPSGNPAGHVPFAVLTLPAT